MLSTIRGLVTVTVPIFGYKVVTPSHSKGVPLEATKKCIFKYRFDRKWPSQQIGLRRLAEVVCDKLALGRLTEVV